MLRDISMPVGDGVPVWPGDTPYARTETAWGDIRVGAVTLSLHTGTHADAPRHFLDQGAAVADLDPAAFVGPAQVLRVADRTTIRPEDLGVPRAPRLLLRTDAWTDRAAFPERVPVLAPDAVAHLAAHGVVLLGVDVPSVDPIDSRDLPNHHALAAAGIHIVESLALDAVPDGLYELIALPLRLDGADASPVRAVLRDLPDPRDPLQ